jgi:hypothetical protein
MTDINNDYVGSLTVAQFIITMSVFEFYKVNLYILSVDPRGRKDCDCHEPP